jgi:glucose-fructose oxidoreductase
VDAVAITLGHQLHHRLTVDACNAGKHVLVEKPMAISLEQCDQMMQAADDNNVKLMIGLTQHFYGTSLKAKEILDSGQLSYPPPTAAPIVDMSFRPN